MNENDKRDSQTASTPMAAPAAPAAAPDKTSSRRPALIIVASVVLLAGIAAGAYWMLVGRNYEDTDDAYVGGRVIMVTPQTSGTVVAIGADETDTVAPGQMLVRLDPVDAHVDLLGREAQLAQVVRETRTLYANNDVLQANVALREAELARANDDLERRRSVRGLGVVSEEEIRHAENTVATARAALDSAREQLRSNRSYTAGTNVAMHPNVQAAAARVREAYLAVKRGEIVAPVGGQIARRSVQVGERVAPGTALMSLVPMDNLWVDANFKEVQLANMRIGQPARIIADVYGNQVEYHGRVIGLGAGTGSAFALLPAQNATGNWIKVVQRVPVRIALDPKELHEHPLRVGLSIRATVDVRNRDGQVVSAHNVASADNLTTVFDSGEREADVLVGRIVASNSVPAGRGTASADADAPAATAAARSGAAAGAVAAAPGAAQPVQAVELSQGAAR